MSRCLFAVSKSINQLHLINMLFLSQRQPRRTFALDFVCWISVYLNNLQWYCHWIGMKYKQKRDEAHKKRKRSRSNSICLQTDASSECIFCTFFCVNVKAPKKVIEFLYFTLSTRFGHNSEANAQYIFFISCEKSMG